MRRGSPVGAQHGATAGAGYFDDGPPRLDHGKHRQPITPFYSSPGYAGTYPGRWRDSYAHHDKMTMVRSRGRKCLSCLAFRALRRRGRADSLAFLLPAQGFRREARFVLIRCCACEGSWAVKEQHFKVSFIYYLQLVNLPFLRFTDGEQISQ